MPDGGNPFLAILADPGGGAEEIDDALLDRLAGVESGGRDDAVSPKGAIGRYQFMPETAAELGIDPRDPAQAREGARRYLQQNLDRFGSVDDALAAYNWGPGNVEKWIAQGRPPDAMPEETRAYLVKMGRAAPGAGARNVPQGTLRDIPLRRDDAAALPQGGQDLGVAPLLLDLERGENPFDAILTQPRRQAPAEQEGGLRAAAASGLQASLLSAGEQLAIGKFLAGGDPAEAAKAISASARERAGLYVPQSIMQAAEGGDWKSVWKGIASQPGEFLTYLLTSSAAQMAVPMATGAAGGAAGSVIPGIGTLAGGAAGVGLGSFAVEAAADLLDGIQQSGVDLTDEAALTRALQDSALIERIVREKALPKAAVVAAFDALSVGLAGRFVEGARGLGSFLGRSGAELGTQAGLGMGGSALGSKAAGQRPEPLDVFAEGILEVPFSVPEVVAGAYLRRRGAPGAQQPPPGGEQAPTTAEPSPQAEPAPAPPQAEETPPEPPAAEAPPLQAGQRVNVDVGGERVDGVVEEVAAIDDSEGGAVPGARIRLDDGGVVDDAIAALDPRPVEPAAQPAPKQPAAPEPSAPEPSAIDAEAAEAAPAPTEPQKEAGNYKKGHVRFHGLDISIETPRGGERTGTAPDGTLWRVTMPAHYGYIRRTEGADDEQVDVYLGLDEQSERAFVVDQIDPETGAFDEHKVVLGATNRDDAVYLYDRGFSDGSGPQRRGAVTEMSVDELKDWLKSGDTKAPLAYKQPPSLPSAPPAMDQSPAGAGATTPAGADEERAAAQPQPSAPVEADNPFAAILDQEPLPPALREQRDLLGGPTVTEADMVVRERAESALGQLRAAGMTDAEIARALAIGAEEGFNVAADEFDALEGEPLDALFDLSDAEVAEVSRLAKAGAGKEAEREAALAPKPEPKRKRKTPAERRNAKAAASEWREIGRNAMGEVLYEDQRGVRSYVERGVRITEPVQIRPDGGISVDRSREPQTWEVAGAKQPAAPSSEQEASDGELRALPDDAAAAPDAASPAPVRPDEGGGRAEPPPERDRPADGGERRTDAPEPARKEPPARRDGGADAAPELGGEDRRGDGAERVPAEGRGDGEPDRPERRVRGLNYRIGADDKIGAGGAKTKARQNIAAIRLLKQLEADDRPATREDQAVLVKYAGWGGMPQIFDEKNAEWAKLRDELRPLLTEEEWAAARASTINAHYTSPEVIGAIWDAVAALGFGGGRVLEPGMGVGHFLGLSPEGLAGKLRFTGVELDSVTGRIARQLYPEAQVHVAGFETVALPPDSFDLAIGNVPFANVQPYDPVYNQARYSLHDYFFAKSLALVKPGGLVAYITTHFTLDKTDAKLRKALAKDADLLGAIRLPRTAFKENAGTEVVTDVVILRKRKPGEEPAGPDWIKAGWFEQEGSKARVNEYFDAQPHMVLGRQAFTGSMYGPNAEYTVEPADEPLSDLLLKAWSFISAEAWRRERTFATDAAPAETVEALAVAPSEVKDGAYFLGENDQLLVKRGAEAYPADVPEAAADRVKLLVRLRDTAREVLSAQRQEWDGRGEAPWTKPQAKLNRLYERFERAYGPINKTTFRTQTLKSGEERTYRSYPNLRHFDDDPDVYLVAALELYDEESGAAEKAPIFTKRVIEPEREIARVDDPKDGLLASLNLHGRVDLDWIAEKSGRKRAQVLADLKGLIFRNPANGEWEPQDAYLSGDVRAKLAVARQAAKSDQAYAENVEALEKVQPEDLPPSQIGAALGAPWIPADDVAAFVNDLLGVDDAKVTHLRGEALWRVSLTRANALSVAATAEWGTQRMPAPHLVELALNQKLPEVFDEDADGKRHKNADETLAAREKHEQIKERFKEWLWSEPKRAERLARFYNDNFNNIRVRQFDGAHLTLPGSTNVITLRPHQKAAVWRILQTGNTLLGHVVGAGKTFTMVAAGMEMKRLGLAAKPMYVVPNHMLEQFSRELLMLYPAAKILVADRRNFEGPKRKQFVARAATGDWDGVIVTHSAFGKIATSPRFQIDFVQGQIGEYEEMIRAERGDRVAVKELEKAKKRRQEKLKALMAAEKRDTGVTFEETGCDFLLVDEAHLFKNLEFPTKMQGVNASSSERAWDLFMKMRYLEGVRPGRAAAFATGTPISNTIAEMFTMQRYLQMEALKARGIAHFDGWAAAFGDTVTALEVAPDGSGFRINSRFARFRNVPELVSMFREIADIQTAEMLNLPRPALAGGKAETVAVKASPALKAYVADLVERAEKVRRREVDSTEDNMLKITGDGRKAALDMRLVDPGAEPEDSRKISAAAERVFAIWEETRRERLAQLVFCDLSTPRADAFSAYNELRRQLVSKGVPAKEIKFIHDFEKDEQKARLFADVRAGKVRVLLGSTAKMGVGTNVQKRLYALHHLDAPWRPADVEQRDGRILRQGNDNPEVRILRYVTEGSFDAYMWQTLERKAGFVGQVITGQVAAREIEDVDTQALSYAEVKAISTGNPLIMQKAGVDAEIAKLSRLKAAFDDQRWRLRQIAAAAPADIERARARIEGLKADIARRKDTRGDAFAMTLGKQKFDKRAEAGKALAEEIMRLHLKAQDDEKGAKPREQKIGAIGGFDLRAWVMKDHPRPSLIIKASQDVEIDVDLESLGGALARVENALQRFEQQIGQQEELIRRSEKQLADAKAQLARPFEHADRLAALQKEQAELAEKLDLTGKPKQEGPAADLDAPAGEDEEPQYSLGQFGKRPLDPKGRIAIVEAASRYADMPPRRARMKARRDALRSVRGAYRNEDTGWEIEVGKPGIGKSLAGDGSAVRAEIVMRLPALLRGAVLVESHEDRANRSDVPIVHRFYAPFRLDGRLNRVKLTVREDGRGARRHYAVESAEIAEPDVFGSVAPSGGVAQQSPEVAPLPPGAPSGSSIEVGDLLAGVNYEDGTPIFPAPANARLRAPALTPLFAAEQDAIKADLLRIAREINPAVRVEFVERLFGSGAAVRRSGAASARRQEVAGAFHRLRMLAEISLNQDAAGLTETTFHELWHSLERLLTEDERAILRRAFPPREGRSFEEEVAVAFADWATKRRMPAARGVRRVFAKIRRFLTNVAAMLRGRGFRSVEDIFEAGRTGLLARRQGGEGARQSPRSLGVAGAEPAPGAFERRPGETKYAATQPRVSNLVGKTLGQAADAIAKALGARKIGQGRTFGKEGKRSRYYKLPNGAELRISDHQYPHKTGGGVAAVDVVIDPENGEAEIRQHRVETGVKLGLERYWSLSLSAPAGPATNIRGEPIPDMLGFDGDEAGWSAAVLQAIREAAEGGETQYALLRRLVPDADPAEASRLIRADAGRLVREAFKGAEPDEGVEVIRPRAAGDVPFYKRFLFTPEAIFRKHSPRLFEVWKKVAELNDRQSQMARELKNELSAIARPLGKSGLADLSALLFKGDALEREFTRAELEAGAFEEEGESQPLLDDDRRPDEKLIGAYLAMRKFMEKLGRLVDQHERKMRPSLRARKLQLVRMLARRRQMKEEDFRKLVARVLALRSKFRRAEYAGGSKEDPATLAARIQEAEAEMLGRLLDENGEIADPQFMEQYQELLQIEDRLQKTSIRRREGYFPHKFFGSFAVYQVDEIPDEEAEGGVREEHTLIAHERNGFYPDMDSAIRAANAYAQNNEGARLVVRPVEFQFPNAEATELSDAAYFRFLGRVSDLLEVGLEDAREQTQGVARRRYRRRIAGFKRFRKGVEGYSRQIEEVLQAHVGEVVRYVTMDEAKYLAINAIEKEGLSTRRSTIQERPVLAAVANNWFRDVNGQKQPIETQIDELFDKPWATPLNTALGSGALAFLAAGGLSGNPLVGMLVGSYVGYRFYRAAAQGGQFKTRALTGSMLSDMAHLKLGSFFNLFSALVNLSQTVMNTLPLLGSRWTMVGLQRYLAAVTAGRNAQKKDAAELTRADRDWLLLRRVNVDTAFKHSETNPHLFERESRLARASLFFFNQTESLNRGVAFLGAYARAEANGATALQGGRMLKGPAAARKLATDFMRRTQFDYSNINKPELLRSVLARVPLQFKNFMAQQIAFAAGLSPAEFARFSLAVFLMAGALGLPGLDLLDELMQALAGFSPLDWIKTSALEAQAAGELRGTIASFLARGLPSLFGADLSTRVGLGEKFLPLDLRDWQGPWFSTIANAARFGDENATLVDQIRNLSSGFGAPLKALEAQANGLPLIETAVRDPARLLDALADDRRVLTSPWKRGRVEYEPTAGELALKAIGGSPLREAQLRDLNAIGLRRQEVLDAARTRYIDRVVRAIRDGDADQVAGIIEEAREDEVMLTPTQLKRALEAAHKPRALRLLEQMNKQLRPEMWALLAGIDQPGGQSGVRQ